MKNHHILFVYIMLVFSLVLLIFGGSQLYRKLKVENSGIQTEGVITEYLSKTKSSQAIFGNKKLVYSPSFSFVTKDDFNFTLNNGNYQDFKPYEIGESVLLKYDIDEPKNVYIDNQYLWKFSSLLVTIASILFVFSIYELQTRIKN